MARGRKTSLKTFLKEMAKELTNSPDYRLSSFVTGLNSNNNHLAMSYVFLYALTNEERSLFKHLLSGDQIWLFETLERERNRYGTLVMFMQKQKNEVGDIYQEYLSFIGKDASNSVSKTAAREAIENLMSAKEVTIYQVSRGCGINSGNLYKFLVSGDYCALSLKEANKVLNFLFSF